MKAYGAEFFGTFWLVLGGCGTAVLAAASSLTKGTAAAYLRGDQNSILNLDRTGVNIRDEYTVSGRTFVFGQLDYLRDKFKQIIFLWVPAGGVGFKLVNTDATQFILDGAVGGLVEKNPGLRSSKSGNLELKLEFIDSYKNKPANPKLEKNDTAFVTAFVVKF